MHYVKVTTPNHASRRVYADSLSVFRTHLKTAPLEPLAAAGSVLKPFVLSTMFLELLSAAAVMSAAELTHWCRSSRLDDLSQQGRVDWQVKTAHFVPI